jgi:hypothetical protein
MRNVEKNPSFFSSVNMEEGCNPWSGQIRLSGILEKRPVASRELLTVIPRVQAEAY